MSVETLSRRFYADRKYDGTRVFYNWVRQYTSPQAKLLNLGAGPPTESPTRIFKGEVAEVVGADVDDCVLENGELDRAVLIKDGKLPFPDGYFDVALSDYVLEHVEHPAQFLAEVARVLKPGGSYLFRTPNILHYVAIISAITPHWFHSFVANRARLNPEGSQEPWPTYYRMNSRGALARLSRDAGFSSIETRMIEAEPSYLQFHAAPYLLGVAYERLVNSTEMLGALRSNIFGRMQK
jgi:SAM-dependent methyltransferase